jgi:hypothetical protein
MLPTFQAIEFHSILRGSTRPVLAVCRDQDGHDKEIVLKPVGTLKRGTFSRAAEALGSMLAKDLACLSQSHVSLKSPDPSLNVSRIPSWLRPLSEASA